MDPLATTDRDGTPEWEEDSMDTNRCSAFTQHLMLAEMIRNHQHLTPRASKLTSHDGSSFYSISTDQSDLKREDSPTIPPIDTYLPTPSVTPLPTPLPTPLCTPSPSRPVSNQANVGKLRARTSRTFAPARISTDENTFRPTIPRRTSSMNTGRRLDTPPSRFDLISFHHRSRQLFSSLDSALSTGFASTASSSHSSSPSTSPSLASSVTTQATSILDDEWHMGSSYRPLHLELRDPRVVIMDATQRNVDFGDFLGSPQLSSELTTQRSASKLSPRITSTEQMFWTSEETRNAEYAKIDAAHSGIKGFFRRMLPKRWARAHAKRRNFYSVRSPAISDNGPGTDDDSVRRYRISIASATQEAILNAELHGVSNSNNNRKSMPQQLTDAFASGYFSQQADTAAMLECHATKTPSKPKKPKKAASTENLSKFLVTSQTIRRMVS